MNRSFTLSIASLMLMIVSCGKADTSAIEARLDAIEKVSIASLQSQMSQINTTIGNLQATQSQLSGFVTNLQTSVGTLDGNYSSLNTAVDNLGKQNSKFEKDIADLAKAVDDCGKDVKKWVEESYTTLTKFSELQGEVSTIKTNIQTIFSRLDGLDSETKRISDGLRDLSTELNEKLGKCEGEIEGIKEDLKALQDDVDSIKEQIAAVVSAVQSVVVVPDYSDGSVKLSKVADNKVYFEVYPLTAAEEISKVGPSSFSLDYVETLTKSTKELINLPITAVSFDGKMLLVTVDGTGLPDTIIEGTKTASARLRISDGTVTRSSEYFPIYRKESGSGSGSQQNGIAITGEALNIGDSSATLYGWSNQDGSAGASVIFGIEYSATDLTTAATTVSASEKDAENRYSCRITGLMYNTIYYYRAFTLYNGIRAYGQVKTFKTEPCYEIVDLGLSVKWRGWNLGASKPEEYGDYYAWGETEPKENYSWSTYKWCNGSSSTLTKYNTTSSYGPVDNKTVLDAADDVASVKLSGKWRMPTDAEWTELRTKCTWTWTTLHGVNGRWVTAPNGNYIFLPAAGGWFDTDLGVAGSFGYYWSSSLNANSPSSATYVWFQSSAVIKESGGSRFIGFSVRPVSE
ncbi:MAG: hypothetical protein J6Y31_04930 [Bacteroidales bacterium]|nr:hypothetical protein [Bacteroidales bacterium]